MGIKEIIKKFRASSSKETEETKGTLGTYSEDEVKLLMQVMEFNERKVSPAAAALAKYFSDMSSMLLDNKVDNFIEWYTDNMVKGKYSSLGEYCMPRELRNFIEKMAVWYELRYPSYEINRRMYCGGQEGIDVSKVMFDNNSYINDIFGEQDDVRALDWDEFYNVEAFINSLPWEERVYLMKPKFNSLVYVDNVIHLHLSSDGIVIGCEGIEIYSDKINEHELIGLHIKDVLSLFQEREISLPKDNELESAIGLYEQKEYFREQLLDAVMYRLIERGGAGIGPRRGMLFAKEFKRNIDIPMMYGVEYTDVGLRQFINEYLKLGGSSDLECYRNYFSTIAGDKKFETITIQEILKFKRADVMHMYTDEEIELQQRLVGILNSQINQETLRKETVKKKRLQRKLVKSKKNKR